MKKYKMFIARLRTMYNTRVPAHKIQYTSTWSLSRRTCIDGSMGEIEWNRTTSEKIRDERKTILLPPISKLFNVTPVLSR
jgi:hypothetical protein